MKGKVTDENAEPIIGATVSVKGSATGTITDINGQYSIKVPYGSTLRYSYVGYREESVIAKSNDSKRSDEKRMLSAWKM